MLDKNGATPLSFMYNYHLARPGSSRLSTLEIRDGLTAAALYGICTKALHDVELNREGANTTPSQAADDEAITRRIGPSLSASDWAYEHFESDNRIAHWRNAIQIGVPVIMGFYLTESYHNISINNNTHARPLNEVGSDGHAVTVMGYNDKHDNGALSPGAFYVRDSRGDDFGDKGYWWLPYELVKAHMIVDSWTVIDVTQY